MLKKISHLLFENLLLILVYYLTAQLSVDFLSSPPSNATAIWPPTGISLAAVLLRGYRLLPAIFIADLIIAIEIVGFSDCVAIAFSLMVGFQAMISAWIGTSLIHRFIGRGDPLIQNKSIILFFWLGGVVSLILPSVMTLGLEYWLGMVDKKDIGLGLFTWWLGGVLGTIIFAPITLILFGGESQRSRIVSIVIPLSILFVLLVWLFTYTKNREQQGLESIFQMKSQVLHTETLENIDSIRNELQDFKIFVNQIDDFDQNNMKIFSQYILKYQPEITALAWLPRIVADKKSEFESILGRSIVTQNQKGVFFDSEIKTDYFPVKFIEPRTDYQTMIGLDFSANADWEQVLQSAYISTDIEAIDPLIYYQNDKNQKLTAFVMAVFDKEMRTKNSLKKNDNLSGYVMLLIPFNSIFENAIKRAKVQQINLTISGMGANKDKSMGQVEKIQYDLESIDKTITLNYELKLRYFPTDDFIISYSSDTVSWIFIMGLGVTGLVGFTLLSVTGQTAQTQKQVAKKTKALRVKQKILESYQKNLTHLVDLRTQELENAQEQLVRHERLAAIGRVSGSIAHELRNPLACIRNAVFYLHRKLPASETKWHQYLSIIDDEVSSSNQIITNLLEMSRPIKLEIIQASLHALLSEVFEANISTTDNSVNYNFNLEPDFFEVQCDSTKMKLVFENLLSNALENIEKTREIIVTATRDNDYDIITFQDNGSGIDEKDQAFIFEPLYSTKTKGIGLGLWICGEIIKHHKGTITLDNHSDGYTRFVIRIPHF